MTSSQNDEQLEEIRDYLNYVKGFIFSDIENCIKAKANFAVANILMTYTEYVGALISGNLGLNGHSEESFNLFLSYMKWNCDQQYYQDFVVEYLDDAGNKNSMNIYVAFRCGLVHEYFPKFPSMIHNNPDVNYVVSEDKGIGWHENKLRFHTNAYYRDFKEAFTLIEKEVFEKKNQSIIENIQKGLSRIEKRKVLLPSAS